GSGPPAAHADRPRCAALRPRGRRAPSCPRTSSARPTLLEEGLRERLAADARSCTEDFPGNLTATATDEPSTLQIGEPRLVVSTRIRRRLDGDQVCGRHSVNEDAHA